MLKTTGNLDSVMQDRISQHQQVLRIQEAILRVLPVGVDLGLINIALAELLAENTKLMLQPEAHNK